MKLDHYEIENSKLSSSFEFISKGSKGNIRKIVTFEATEIEDVYNLAFGDEDEATGQLDDTVVTNNGDTTKVLATISSIIYSFTDKNPQAIIYFTGSSPSRTRLYKIGISKYIETLLLDYDIYGEVKTEWKSFDKALQYTAFY